MDKETLFFLKFILYVNSWEAEINFSKKKKKKASKKKALKRLSQRSLLFWDRMNCRYSILQRLLSASVVFLCQKEL